MDQKTFRQTLRRAFWIPFAGALLLATTLILEVRFLTNRSGWVEHTDQVISVAEYLYRSRIDQETGVRAYVLTRDSRFLDPYYEGGKQALTLQSELRQLIADNPEQIARNESADQADQAWLAWADQAIAMTKAGENAGGTGFELRGKELMDQYRRAQSQFIEGEQHLRDERLIRSRRTLVFVNTSVVVLITAFAFGFAILGRRQLTTLSHSFAEALDVAVEQRDWFQTTLTSIGDAVIATDAEGQVILMNPTAENLTGWKLKEAQGKALADVFQIVNEETRQSVENPVDKVRRLKRVVGLANHTILMSKNGEEIAIDDSGAPIYNSQGAMTGIVLVFRNVTEQRKAEAKLAQQAGLLDLASDAIIVRDESGRISYWNKGAENLYGWTAQEAFGEITHVLLQSQFPQPLPEIVERFSRQNYWEGELVHTCKNGQRVTVFSRWALIRNDCATPKSLMESNTDITWRKQLETALRSNEKLALAGRLSASIAHEINNPIDTVTNVLHLIGERIDDRQDVGQLITVAQSEAQRVVEITKNMLTMHRESRAASAVDVGELLKGVVNLIEETIAKGRRRIEVADTFKEKIEGFPSELHQVFTNVIKNAVEATTENGEIKIYAEALQESDRDGVLVRVVDNGVGVPEDLQSRLFGPFVTTKEEGGTGLGLWVSRNILEKHGGNIRISNNGGPNAKGTTVSIFLPLKVRARKSA